MGNEIEKFVSLRIANLKVQELFDIRCSIIVDMGILQSLELLCFLALERLVLSLQSGESGVVACFDAN